MTDSVKVEGPVGVRVVSSSGGTTVTTTRTELCRDEFAVAAMQALIGRPQSEAEVDYATYVLQVPAGATPLSVVDWVADASYAMADAMLKRRWR